MPSASAARVNSSGMMKRRASIAAIAITSRASAAPRTPASPGASVTLATTAATAASTIAAIMPASRRVKAGRSLRMNKPEGLARDLRRRRLGRPRDRLPLAVFAAAHARAQLFGNGRRIDTVFDHLRPDEDDQLGAG